MGANIRALRSRQPDSPILIRYAEIARWLTRRIDAQAEDGAAWINQLVAFLQFPKLSALKVPAAHVGEIVARAQESSSMKANPIELNAEELTAALSEAL
jgi:alcohol dehydrogenase class IV